MPIKSKYKPEDFESGDVTFYDEIVRELAEEEGRPYKEIKEMIDLNIRHVKEEARNPEVQQIKLGLNLGNMITCMKTLGREKHYRKRSKYEADHKYADEFLFPKWDIMHEYIDSLNDKQFIASKFMKRPFVQLLVGDVSKYTGRGRNTLSSFTRPYQIWEALSDFQNEKNQ